MGKFGKYRAPRLYKGARWWIEYQFRVPDCVRHSHQNKKWKKFRVFEDINRHKSDEYAQFLLEAVSFGLKNGFDPFEYEKQAQTQQEEERQREEKQQQQQAFAPAASKEWTISAAFKYFQDEWKQRGLESATLSKLDRAIEAMTEWLAKNDLLDQSIRAVNREYVKAALREASDKYEWSNRTFNNNKTALSTVFTFLEDEKMIDENPTHKIVKKRTVSKKHRYYDPEQFERVRNVMKADDPLCYFATKLVYYLCIRAEKELKYFRVGNIFLDRKQVLIQAEEAKTDADRFIPIPDELMAELTYIRKHYPLHYYVVGKGNRIKNVRDNTPSAKPFPNNMISARFAKIRKKAEVSSDHTPYSFKHTRVIHLKLDGGKDQDIMQVTGHTSYQAYAEYLRDLGVDGNPEATNKISRKF